MAAVDKAAIAWSIGIVAVAVGFTSVMSSAPISDIAPIDMKDGELQKEIEVVQRGIEDVKQAAEEVKEVAEEIKQKTESAKEITEKTISAKLPAKFVSIPKGTAIPGCEEVNLCYDPPEVIIFAGGEIIWRNDDTSAHTVTSGTALTGPDNNFDSGLIRGGETFSQLFEQKGEYPYFCMIHPWATGSVIVE